MKLHTSFLTQIKSVFMAKVHYRCSDLGYQCSFEYEGPKPEDILPRIKMHMKYAHQIQELSPEEIEKVKSKFKTVE